MAILGIIADDFTGATDIAGMLVKGGMRTIQTIGVPAKGTIPDDVDAVVVALKTRSIAGRRTRSRSRSTRSTALQAAGCVPVLLQVLLDLRLDRRRATSVRSATRCSTRWARKSGDLLPGLPRERPHDLLRPSVRRRRAAVRHRTCAHHPLTPMTDASLVRVLARQTTAQGRAGAAEAGAGRLRGPARRARQAARPTACATSIVDAVADTDLAHHRRGGRRRPAGHRRLGRRARPARRLSPARAAAAQVGRRRLPRSAAPRRPCSRAPARRRRSARSPASRARISASTPTRSAAASRSPKRRSPGPGRSSATARSCSRPATRPTRSRRCRRKYGVEKSSQRASRRTHGASRARAWSRRASAGWSSPAARPRAPWCGALDVTALRIGRRSIPACRGRPSVGGRACCCWR